MGVQGSRAQGRRTRVHDDDATCFAGGLGVHRMVGVPGIPGKSDAKPITAVPWARD